MLLLEAITPTGSISADWVLVGMGGIIIMLIAGGVILLRNTLAELKAEHKEIFQRMQIHENKLIEQRADINHQKELIEESRTQHSNALEQILSRIG